VPNAVGGLFRWRCDNRSSRRCDPGTPDIDCGGADAGCGQVSARLKGMDEEHRYRRNTRRIVGVAVLAMGLLYFLAAWKMRDAFLAAEIGPIVWSTASPYTLFLLGSLALGWFTAWLGERRGLVTWLPLLASAVIAVGLGLALSVLNIQPWPKSMVIAFGLAVVGFMGAGVLRQKLEG